VSSAAVAALVCAKDGQIVRIEHVMTRMHRQQSAVIRHDMYIRTLITTRS